MRTDHSEIIAEMRKRYDVVEYVAAADLLEMHDSTSLNLHQAPGLLAFVREYAGFAMDGPVEIQDNHA